jgi:hypothetical protein
MKKSDAPSGSLGTAAFSESPDHSSARSRIRLDGPCAEETLGAMERGDRGKPMGRSALEAIRTQAGEILESIVDSYDSQVAPGEVGDGGRARASGSLPKGGKCPTGLLYGRVQSGKTAAMIVTCALAVDNGFRVIIVLTSNNLKLVEQTKDRFGDLDGALIYSSLGSVAGQYDWDRDRGHIQTFVGARGAVFVCAKEDGHLESLIRFLQAIGAADYPALILDDEADHATPDTQQAARARGRNVPHASTTFRLVVENDKPGQVGLSLRETLTHNVFLQVTATPYGLLLQNLTNPLRPAFTRLLKPGAGYNGGESFFASTSESATPPLVYVDETEGRALTKKPMKVPEGLQRSIAFFLVSATAHRLITGSPPRSGYKYLCHTSVKKDVHKNLAEAILSYVDDFAKHIAADPAGALARPEVVWAVSELRKSVASELDLAALEKDIVRHLPKRSMQVVNSEQQSGQLKFDTRFNFLVGGNILGRGLTIDDLLVTYYLRQARMTQMDTMHQHARMYGYRQGVMPYTRVFLTQTLATRFRQIHEGEAALRGLLESDGSGRSVPVEVAGDLRATRSNILDIGALSAYRPGQQVYPVDPVHEPKALGDSVSKLNAMVEAAFGGNINDNEFRQVELATVKEMLETVKVQEDDGDWHTVALLQVLIATASRYADKAYLYVRDHKPRRLSLPSGAISGDEQTAAREKVAPVLFMFRGKKGQPWDADIWYPTIVFPQDMPAVMFNRDA